MALHQVYFSLGTNSGDKEANIRNALKLMTEAFHSEAHSVSNIVETEPWGFESSENFLNCAARFDLDEKPGRILEICKGIERILGRKVIEAQYDDSGKRVYSDRVIDIDIVLYGTLQIDSTELTIPHKSMRDRDFVMIPLKEILSPEIAAHFGI